MASLFRLVVASFSLSEGAPFFFSPAVVSVSQYNETPPQNQRSKPGQSLGRIRLVTDQSKIIMKTFLFHIILMSFCCLGAKLASIKAKAAGTAL